LQSGASLVVSHILEKQSAFIPQRAPGNPLQFPAPSQAFVVWQLGLVCMYGIGEHVPGPEVPVAQEKHEPLHVVEQQTLFAHAGVLQSVPVLHLSPTPQC
jgi:hypothetical protein